MNTDLHCEDLWVTQGELRSVSYVQLLAKLLAFQDGSLTQYQQQPVILAKFEDGRIFVRDGHHRCCALAAIQRPLSADQYRLEQWSYEQWMLPNLSRGWITPFDPRTEMRVGDLRAYKRAFYELIPPDVLRTWKLQGVELSKFYTYLKVFFLPPYKQHRGNMCTVQDLLRLSIE